jgi:hypothetical protein
MDVSIGTFHWQDGSSGTAVLIVCNFDPIAQTGHLGAGFDVKGPAGWNGGQTYRFPSRFAGIRRENLLVYWFVVPESEPVLGSYRLEAFPSSIGVSDTASLSAMSPLARPAPVTAQAVAGGAQISWPAAGGASSYMAVLHRSAATFRTEAPVGVWLYTTANSAMLAASSGDYWPQVFAFRVDMTKLPSTTIQFDVSWASADKVTVP